MKDVVGMMSEAMRETCAELEGELTGPLVEGGLLETMIRSALAALEAQGYAVVKRGSTGVHHPAEPFAPAPPTEREPLKSMLEKARKHVMTDEEIAAQRESWARQMKD
jgi:hypothetical protein